MLLGYIGILIIRGEKMKKLLLLLFIVFMTGCDNSIEEIEDYKPVLYFYPEEDINVSVKFSHPEYLLTTYPKYDNGWEVKVLKNGTIVDKNREYYALYWDEKSKDRGVEKPVKENDHACILGDTLIETKEGKKKIKDLVGTSGKCYCINIKTRRKAIGNYSNVMYTGKNKKCYKVKLSNGKVIEATEDHYVLTKKGWKQIKDLNIKEDKVVKINYVK